MMKKLLLVALMLAFLPAANAQIMFRLGSTKTNIDGMNMILPEAVHIKNGVGMAPVRLLLMEAGKSMFPLSAKTDSATYPEGIDRNEIKTAFDRFEKPCLIMNPDGTYFGTIGIDSNLIKIGENFSDLPQKTYILEGVYFAPMREMCKHLGLVIWTKDGNFYISKAVDEKPPQKWTDWLLDRISLETLLLICFGTVVFFIILFFILTPLRRSRANRDKA